MFLQLSEHCVVLSVGSEVLELRHELVHQTFDGDGNDVALNDKLRGCHDDRLEEGNGEDVAE